MAESDSGEQEERIADRKLAITNEWKKKNKRKLEGKEDY